MSDVQNMEMYIGWSTSASKVHGIVGLSERKIWSVAVCVLWGSLRATVKHILRNSFFSFTIGKFSSLCHDLRVWFLCECIHLIFWGSLEKLTTSVIKERQTEIVRASFAKASSLCHQDGRGRTNTRRSGWTRGNGSTPGSQHDEHLFCSFFEWEGETSRRRQISDTYLFVELVRLWSHSKFVKITTPFGVRLWKSLFETFQGTFVCVSLEYEQGRVSCVIRADNVERFFWFCGAFVSWDRCWRDFLGDIVSLQS